MKLITAAVTAMALTASASGAFAACDEGEIVIKLSHVTNTDKHPKGIAATLLQSRVDSVTLDTGGAGLMLNTMNGALPISAVRRVM